MDPAPPPPPEAPSPPEPERDAAAEAAATERKRVELTTELRRARGWILGVGITMYLVDMFMVWGGKSSEEWPAWLRYQISLIDGIILLMFVTLWWFARRQPRLCCILALAVYWGLQAWV